MGSVEEFERRIDAVAAAGEWAARMVDANGAAGVRPEIVEATSDDNSRGRQLAERLRLTDDELDFLWTVVARAVDARVAAHLRAVFGGETRAGASLAQHLALRPLPAPRSRALAAVLDRRHPLRKHGILLAADDSCDVTTAWTVSTRLWSWLRGSDRLDAAIEAVGCVVEPPEPELSAEQRELVARLRGWIGAPGATVVLEGAFGSGRRVAVALAAAPRPVVAVDFARMAPRRAEAVLLALWREAILRDAIPVLANLDELWSRLQPGDETILAISSAIDAAAGPLVVTTSTPGLDVHAATRSVLRVRWPLPEVETRRALWTRVLQDVSTEHLDLLSVRYEMGAGGIVAAARSAAHRAESRNQLQPSFDEVVAGVQDNIAERLGELARRVEVRQDWSELTLPPETHDDVRALMGRIRHAHFVLDTWGFRRKLARGTGVAALFSGQPGTGKTMVAGLIARELQLELYQVDLSKIVSKWVGETEKQLARVFEAAEAGHALLLFDEADSLFAKRSAEVKSAVDRYANLEVNYLLQRVESFGGVVILTTNLDASIDPALRRRLASHIVFQSPDLDERRQLWERMLATGAPIDADVDLDDLAAEFSDMTGANIRNAALAAAFLAAEEGKTIGVSHLHRAARGEYRAMGRVLGADRRSPSSGK